MSSVASASDPQIDGRVWVTETHTLDDGTTQQFYYLAEPHLDFQAVANERAEAING